MTREPLTAGGMKPEPIFEDGSVWGIVLVTDEDMRAWLGDKPKRKFVGTPVTFHRCPLCRKENKRKGFCDGCQEIRRTLYLRGYNSGRRRERKGSIDTARAVS